MPSWAAIRLLVRRIFSPQPELAIPTAVDALLKVPGDQGLVDWLVTRLIEHGEPIRAGEVLEANRESLVSRGNSELAYFLGEQIALAKLGNQKLVEPEVKGRWISRLEQDSQAWLTDALSYREKVSGLKLGIAMYYCKIVECELTSKLIVPFIESEPVFDKHQFDSELKGLRDCFNSGWMTLGSIAHSLRVACSSPGASDTALMLAWRSYLNNLPEPQKSAVRDDHFLKTLGMLSRVRNRIAHLGNLNDEEFDNVQNTVFADGEAGSVLQRLGIS
jgi:hypothetical protein